MEARAELLAAGFDPDALSDRWTIVGGPEQQALELELHREVARGHLLHGADVLAVGVHVRRKETIFWVRDRRCWAWVHLTGTVETDPRQPSCVLCSTWSDLVAELADAGRP